MTTRRVHTIPLAAWLLAAFMLLPLRAAEAAWPIVVDATPVTAAFKAADIDSFKCRNSMREFTRAIDAANADAEAKRAKLGQAAGSGGDAGRDAEKDAEAINEELRAACREAAKSLNSSMEWNKLQHSKKGENEIAKKIENFQKVVENWAKRALASPKAPAPPAYQPSQTQAPSWGKPQTQTPSWGKPQTQTSTWGQSNQSTSWGKPQQSTSWGKPQTQTSTWGASPSTQAAVQVAFTTNTVFASSADGTRIGTAKAGDTIEVQYVDGLWMTAGESECPDDDKLRNEGNRCVIVRADDPSVALAVIPGKTRERPYRYWVRENGEYALRSYDGQRNWHRTFFDGNLGRVRYATRVVANPYYSRYASASAGTNAAPSASTASGGLDAGSIVRRLQDESMGGGEIIEVEADSSGKGKASLSFPQNRGVAIIRGLGTEFETRWAPCGNGAVWAHRLGAKLLGVSSKCRHFPKNIAAFERDWDFSESTSPVAEGQMFVLVNEDNRFLAVKVQSIGSGKRGRNSGIIEIEFRIYPGEK